MAIAINELEQAINFWRARSPSVGEERRLCAQAAALAEPYALMIHRRQLSIDLDTLPAAARHAFEEWRAATRA